MIEEILKLIVMVATASLTSGGVVMYWLKKHDRLADLEKKFDRLAEGAKLGLENDMIIFKALREGHINGESEKQEEKLSQFFYKCTMKGFEINHE